MRKAADVTPSELIRIYEEQMQIHSGNNNDVYRLQNLGRIRDDLKVRVDFENHEISPWAELGDECRGIRRFYLKNGADGPQYLTCIGCSAGGDWQYPINFFIYLDQDGKTLRCYVPKRGNAWNWNTNCAFGEDEEADREFLENYAKENEPELHRQIVELDDEWDATLYAECMEDVQEMIYDMRNRIEIAKIPNSV